MTRARSSSASRSLSAASSRGTARASPRRRRTPSADADRSDLKRFVRALLAITAAAHLVFAVALWHLLGGTWVAAAIAAVLAASLSYALSSRIALLVDDRPIHAARRLAERAYYAHWGACLLASCLFVPGLALAALGVASIGAIAVAIYTSSLAVGAYAVFVRTRIPYVRTIELTLEGLPPAFHGYRVVQLSDVHIGSLFPLEAARRFADIANGLAPDLVALTGDYLTSGTRFHEDVARLVTSLRAKDGTFLVWGNHDNYGDREPLRSLLLGGGVRILENESHVLERDGGRLTIVGVEDIYSRRTDVAKTFEGVDGGAILALVHDPKLFHAVAERGASLVLTGHTHWGQVAMPLAGERLNLARRFFRFSGGLYRENGSTLYVHPGVGATGPPLRFGVPPEVTLFVLRAPGA